MKEFGDHLKELRSQRGLSQEELAEMVTMHKTHISRYERNLAKPTVEVVKKMCEALDVSADLLVFGDQDRMAQERIKNSDLLSLFNKVQQLESKDLEVIISLMEAYILKTELQTKLRV